MNEEMKDCDKKLIYQLIDSFLQLVIDVQQNERFKIVGLLIVKTIFVRRFSYFSFAFCFLKS